MTGLLVLLTLAAVPYLASQVHRIRKPTQAWDITYNADGSRTYSGDVPWDDLPERLRPRDGDWHIG